MPIVNLEVRGDLARALGSDGRRPGLVWQAEVASGDTLGRLLERLSYELGGFDTVYDAGSRRLKSELALTVNGRPYGLIGGLTYLLHEGDALAFELG